MKLTKSSTETYYITDIENLDPVTVYVSNNAPGKGMIVIECFGSAWSAYWGGMSGKTIQGFILSSDNQYLINRLSKNVTETDFDEINEIASKRGYSLCVTSDIEVAMQADEMCDVFGPDWMMDLPTHATSEYHYLCRILAAIRSAFVEDAKND